MTTMLPAAAPAQTARPATPGPAVTESLALGDFAVTPLLAGKVISDNPIATYALNVDPAEFARVCTDNFLPSAKSGNSFTPSLVKAGDALVLFDTGLNPEGILAALAQAGVAPEAITHVVLTHMHGDHIGGLMGEGPTFPNAELIVPRAENDYWAAQDNDAYKAKVLPLIGKARQIGDSDEILPGIRAEAAHGHTPGHTTYLLTSGEKQLLLSGDSFNHYVFSVAHPEWQVRFDADKEAAIQTRKKVLERLAVDRIPFIGYHMPYPAVGFISRRGEGYRFVPATYQFAV
ncbi:MBL fold metallo-hydrolase [Paracoccus aminophilus]|nr:MBL fold metallo-hydrolase [Paracoccus aminophilus]